MIGLPELAIASIGIIIAGGGMLWRMHTAQNKRMDQMQRDLTHRMDTVTAELRTSLMNRMDTVTAELRTSLETSTTELRQGQQILTESLSKLDSRISRLEGMLQPRPWVEASPAHPESSAVT